jgi:hypothetical protein
MRSRLGCLKSNYFGNLTAKRFKLLTVSIFTVNLILRQRHLHSTLILRLLMKL